MITIRNLQEKDDKVEEKEKILNIIAEHYADYYSNSVLGEKWAKEKAVELFNYFYKQNKDLFFVAYDEDKPVGVVMSVLKPWEDGYQLTDGEIFVIKDYQHKGIATQLMKTLFVYARDNYHATTVQELTYEDENGFPLNWYKRIGYKTLDDLKVIGGDINEIINNIQQTECESRKSVQSTQNNNQQAFKGDLHFTVQGHPENLGPYSMVCGTNNDDLGYVSVTAPVKQYRLLQVLKGHTL